MTFEFSMSSSKFKSLVFQVLPLTFITPIVSWQFSWLLAPAVFLGWFNFWNKVVAVGSLAFFPLIQALWGLRGQPRIFRIMLAVEYALPVAFVMMLFGESFGATAGIGFMITLANAALQTDKALAGFLITVVLLAGLSFFLRLAAKRLSARETSAPRVPT